MKHRAGRKVAAIAALTTMGIAGGGGNVFDVLAQMIAPEAVADMVVTNTAPTIKAVSLAAPRSVPGTFEAEDFDRGGEWLGYHDNVPGNAGGQYRPKEDVDIVVSTDPEGGRYDINNFETGEWLAYTLEVSETADYALSLRIASALATSAFRIRIDGKDVSGRVAVPNTGGWRQYQWVGAPRFKLTAGQHRLRIIAVSQYFNLNSVRLVTAPVPSPYSGVPLAVPGTFEAEDFDLGGEGVGYHDKVPGNAGSQHRPDEDVDIFASGDAAGGLYDINHFETGEWLAYTIEVAETGDYDVALRVASALSDSAFRIEIDGQNLSGRVAVANTGGWNSYQWITVPGVSLSAGQHLLKIVAVEQYFNLNRVRATVPGNVAPIDPAAVLFSCSFPILSIDCGFQEQAKVSGRASIVTIARDGGTALRLHTKPGDNNVAGSGNMERNDLWLTQAATDGYEGREHWWAHSLFLPDDFTTPTWHNYVLFDFHNTSTGGGQANFHVLNRNGVLTFQGYGGVTSGNEPVNPFSAPIGPIRKNVWYDFVYHVRWSSGADGYFDAWVNGERILSHRGPTLYAGQGVYLKLANYHNPICDPYPACIGTHGPSSVIHDRIIRGSTALAVATGPLEGVLELVNGVLTPLAP